MGGKGGLTEFTRYRFDTPPNPTEKQKMMDEISGLIDAATRSLSVIVLVEPDQPEQAAEHNSG